jgi:hypothetical protein
MRATPPLFRFRGDLHEGVAGAGVLALAEIADRGFPGVDLIKSCESLIRFPFLGSETRSGLKMLGRVQKIAEK